VITSSILGSHGILGWGDSQQRDLDSLVGSGADPRLTPARVASVDRGALTVLGALSDPLAPVLVPHRHGAGLDTPAAGDWVLLHARGDAWVMEALLPRTSLFVRKEAGRGSSAQPVAANVDRVLVVTAVGDDLSPGRIERYVTAIHAGGASPLLVVNKVDRAEDVEAVLAEVRAAAPETDIVMASALSEGGLEALLAFVPPPMTVALVGSSGVGKTTILNRLLGGGARATTEVRASDDKGRHTTTRRELCVTPSGLIVIDTPGVREIGLWDASAGLSAAFPDIVELAAGCRFSDCAHAHEPGCAVRAAVEQGSLPSARLDRYERLVREIAHNDARADHHRSQNQKQRWKAIHKGQRDRQKLERKLGLKGW
jgi:ribosome biogenesis GTPase / thiamine phosphate phosphatase